MEAGLDKMRRIIREEEPPRPSTRLITMSNAELTTVANHRRSEPPRLVSLVRGDLDWIVMKALEKDRTRRYETVNGLAADVSRHLNNEPVMARPPSRLYRLQKSIQRNKYAFGAGAAVAFSLLAGIGVSTSLFLKEAEARKREEQLRKESQEDVKFIGGLILTHAIQSGKDEQTETTEELFQLMLDRGRARTNNVQIAFA
jgi:hypothetical protein